MKLEDAIDSGELQPLELVTYQPDDPETFPSVCPTPEDVERRFGFKGDELLVFDQNGSYIGQLVKLLDHREPSESG